MNFNVEIRNIDTLEVESRNIEGPNVQQTHKHILMDILENNEEVVLMTDETGKVVFEENKGFS